MLEQLIAFSSARLHHNLRSHLNSTSDFGPALVRLAITDLCPPLVTYTAMPPKRRRAEASDSRVNADSSAAEVLPSAAEQLESPTHRESLSPTSEHNSSDTNNAGNSTAPLRKKSEPVKSACGQCQKRKTKCSGERPVCEYCRERGLDCSWEIGDGLTRNADLRQRLADANEHAIDINTLVHDMRTNTDAVGTTPLAKLRLGDSIQDLATGIRDGTSMQGNDRYEHARRPSQGTER